jgi:O-phospho-L-seryl-tRNASec:L-selenocysteinyl-tRNA synthase
MLFSRGVSGTRVVHPAATSTIDGRTFTGYGSQCEGGYPHAYITVAAAMGMTRGDVDVLMGRLDKTIGEFRKQKDRADATLLRHAAEGTEVASTPATGHGALVAGAGSDCS